MTNQWPGWERLVEFRMVTWDVHWGWTWWLALAIGIASVYMQDDVLRVIRLVGMHGSIPGEVTNIGKCEEEELP